MMVFNAIQVLLRWKEKGEKVGGKDKKTQDQVR